MSNFNEQTGLGEDKCEILSQQKANDKASTYLLTNYIQNLNSRNSYLQGLSELGTLQTGNDGGMAKYIDHSSKLRNGQSGYKITHEKPKSCSLLNHRMFVGGPNKSAGNAGTMNTDVGSMLQMGKIREKNSRQLTEKEFNNFTPLIPYLKKNIQNPDHLVPKYWVRGGMDTRSTTRNMDYLKACNLKG